MRKGRNGGFSGIVKVIARPKLVAVASISIAMIFGLFVIGSSNLVVFQKDLFSKNSDQSAATVPLVNQPPRTGSEQLVTPSSSTAVLVAQASNSSEATEVALPSESSSSSSVVEITDETFDLLSTDPDKYAGSAARISGKVYDVLDQSSSSYVIVSFKLFSQAIDSDESRAMIMYQEVKRARTVSPEIEKDDCISIEGKVRGGIAETNSLGQSIRIPLIDASGIAEIECIDSALPPVQTIELNVPQSFGGITLTASRVQLTQDHVRIKITAVNTEAGDSVFIRGMESFMVHDASEYHNINRSTQYASYMLDPEIVSGYPSSGYLFFEPIGQYDGDTLVFKIIVEKVELSGSTKSTFIFTI